MLFDTVIVIIKGLGYMKTIIHDTTADNKAASSPSHLRQKASKNSSDVSEEICRDFLAKIRLADSALKLIMF